MRYEAKKAPINEEWGVWDNVKEHFIIADDGLLLESAAHIIAFALNSVAEGDNLYRGPIPDWTSLYDGPTEGVAPPTDGGRGA